MIKLILNANMHPGRQKRKILDGEYYHQDVVLVVVPYSHPICMPHNWHAFVVISDKSPPAHSTTF